MQVNEGFVVYLFCRFHERLGFDKILWIDAYFPDCIAEKNGKKVRIEFESDAYFLRNHLKVRTYWSQIYKIVETDEKYVIKDRDLDLTIEEYPKSEYKIRNYPNGQFEVLYRKLPLDYCICWKTKRQTRERFREVKIIELSKIPFIISFLKQKGYIQKV